MTGFGLMLRKDSMPKPAIPAGAGRRQLEGFAETQFTEQGTEAGRAPTRQLKTSLSTDFLGLAVVVVGVAIVALLALNSSTPSGAAIKMRAGNAPDDYVSFYDQMVDEVS